MPAKLAVVYILTTVAGYAVFWCSQFAFWFCLVAVVAAKLFMRTVNGEISGFVMIE